MHRFFAAAIQGGRARLDGEEAGHLCRVLRLGPGDEVIACDGAGQDYLARVLQADPKQALLDLIAPIDNAAEPRVRVTLYQGLPKAGKLETVIQKATELGAARVVPIQAARSVVKVQPDRQGDRVARYQRVAFEACKQCGRARTPEVTAPMSFAQAEGRLREHDLLLLPWEQAREGSLYAALAAAREAGTVGDVGLVIGPEGGLAPEEVVRLEQLGAKTVTLGARILRTETAAVAALACVMFALGEMGGWR